MRAASILLALISAFLLADATHGEINCVSSVDWLVVQADVICAGQVESVETKAENGLWVEKVRMKVTECVQNCKSGETIAFAYQISDDTTRSRKWLFSKGGVLVLLRKTELSERLLDSSLTPVTVIELSSDTNKGFYTHDFRKLTSGSAIKGEIEAARSRLIEYRQRTAGATVGRVDVNVPGNSEMFKELYAGSVVLLTVPDYLTKKKE